MLFGATGSVRITVFAQHLQLIVDELGRTNLNWVLGLQLVRGRVISEPKRGLSMRTDGLADNFLLLLGQHDHLLLALL